MSNALLLRLFTSEYFNAWIAISYIFRYPDNVGIQHYLCTQLRKFPIAEIEFFLPQLMHLLITRPTESVALECYIIDACEKSTHIAVMSLWYLQAYLSDLASTPNHPSFQLCKRVFNRCQSIVFSEEEQIYASQQVRENTFPTLVGMGALLAGIGQPLVTKPVGSVALAQGRKPRPFSFLPDALETNISILREKHFTVSLEDLHKGKAFSVSRYLKQAKQKINHTVRSTLVSHDANAPSQLLNGGGMDPINMKAMAQSSVPLDQVLVYALSKLSLDDRRHLLRSNYFRSEMQFLLALVDIATRLVIVPKRARLSALHAELTLLNHNLPAEICMPLWCPATVDRPYHHRIVRISPTDAVVLNSAERAPYLLMIEVLDDELNDDDLGDLGSPTSTHSFDIPRSVSSSTISSSVVAVDPSVPGSDSSYHLFDAEGFAEKMKTAAILLAQLQIDNPQQENTTIRASTDGIRQKIIAEMMALEDDRMEKMAAHGVDSGIGVDGGHELDDESRVAMVVNKEDPSAAVFSENWETKKERIRAESPYGHLPNWRLISVIVKNGADLRQEQFAIQLIREMQKIWQDTKLDAWVQYVRILVTSDDSGLIETIKNAISIHSIKKEAYIRKWNPEGQVFSLQDYYQRRWGLPGTASYKKAQDAFMRSLAGYSIASYLLQIKDRHNGNILIDDAGHIIHIDFGFILSNSPGSVGFEMAPFKLSQEYIDILGGIHSEKFAEYRALMKSAFIAVRKHSDNILLLTEMMSKDSKLPCFVNGQHALSQLRDRFQLQLTDPQVEAFVDKLIMSSCGNVFTRLYDTYQYYSQVKNKNNEM
ncbi:kinase-like domain-containing protein [Helicostylum pulchrum]|nr:kinase-like domain-containing protein [Helicostylum pulchrum]